MESNKHINPQISNDLLEIIHQHQCRGIHIRCDKKTGLNAIIALHGRTDLPALGGCRLYPYASTEEAVLDAVRLAQGMSYKSILADVPFSGGKSVLIKPDKINNRAAYFKIMGQFIESLNGAYVAGMDSGTCVEDMDHMSAHTKHVVSTSKQYESGGDPAPFTAQGVYLGLLAAVKHHFQRDNLTKLNILIQGVGNVGYQLAKKCYENGATILVSDLNQKALERCVLEFKATVISPEKIYETACDIFSPCAMGAILNQNTIEKLNTKIIAGSANNQLATEEDGIRLFEKGICYAPDYIINAGGLVHAAREYLGLSASEEQAKIAAIFDRTLSVLTQATEQHIPSNQLADELAMALLRAGGDPTNCS